VAGHRRTGSPRWGGLEALCQSPIVACVRLKSSDFHRGCVPGVSPLRYRERGISGSCSPRVGEPVHPGSEEDGSGIPATCVGVRGNRVFLAPTLGQPNPHLRGSWQHEDGSCKVFHLHGWRERFGKFSAEWAPTMVRAQSGSGFRFVGRSAGARSGRSASVVLQTGGRPFEVEGGRFEGGRIV
jgi:hypothetical protein